MTMMVDDRKLLKRKKVVPSIKSKKSGSWHWETGKKAHAAEPKVEEQTFKYIGFKNIIDRCQKRLMEKA